MATGYVHQVAVLEHMKWPIIWQILKQAGLIDETMMANTETEAGLIDETMMANTETGGADWCNRGGKYWKRDLADWCSHGWQLLFTFFLKEEEEDSSCFVMMA